jgi:RNA polymerase sigma factor for flagellar operon FliA
MKQHERGAWSNEYAVAHDPSHPTREELVTVGLELVRRLGRYFRRKLPAHVELSDLISAGTIGMLGAVEAYDSARNDQFAPYAKARIRGAMLDELRANDILSRHFRNRMDEVDGAMRALRQELGREPDDGEVAQRMQMTLDEYQQLNSDIIRRPVLLRLSMAPVAHVGRSSNPDAEFSSKDLKQRLASAVAALPEREQQIIRAYYEEGQTQTQIGQALGISGARVCQLLARATARLRTLMLARDANADAWCEAADTH